MNKLISIIIPAYNASGFIEETINSVIFQTYDCFELIIVNDGSTDNTSDIINRLASKDKRIRIIEKNNEGVCKARNHGYSISKGEFILFLDADDILHEKILSKTIEIFENNLGVRAIYTKGQIINQHSIKQNEFLEANKIFNQADILEWKVGFMPTPSCTILRRIVIEKIGLWDPKFSTAADQDFFIRVSAFCSIEAINEVLFYYRVHPNNMHQNISLMEKDHIGVFKKAEKNKLFYSKSFKKQCFSNLYKIIAGSWWYDGGNKIKALRFFLVAIYYDFTVLYKVLCKNRK